MSFGNKLREIRKKHHLSQESMSEKLMMEQSTYSRYENNKSSPNIAIINRVVNEFKVSLEWLMQTESKTAIFENGSLNQNLIQTDSYYAVPKDVIETIVQQQQSISLLLKQMIERK